MDGFNELTVYKRIQIIKRNIYCVVGLSLFYNLNYKIMGDLIKIEEKDGKQLVSARELHKFLELDKSQIARWLNSKIIKNPFFTENEDFTRVDIVVEGQKTGDLAITLYQTASND